MTEVSLRIQKNEPLSEHCRFGVGGQADFFVVIKDRKELLEALNFAEEQNLPFFIYSGGSNLFFDDRGFRGLVIKLENGGYEINRGNKIKISAGYNLPKIVRELAKHNLGGIEFLGNIPGSVGGAVVGNAGCYGKAVADVIVSAEIYFIRKKAIRAVWPKFFNFSYRHSALKYDFDKVVLSAVFQLIPRPERNILKEVRKELKERLQKHPHQAKCAGSFFKNPKVMPAWKAITEAGVGKAKVGDAAVSSKHANFLINRGKASSKDLLALARLIRKEVKRRLGINLEPEVRYVGIRGIEDI